MSKGCLIMATTLIKGRGRQKFTLRLSNIWDYRETFCKTRTYCTFVDDATGEEYRWETYTEQNLIENTVYVFTAILEGTRFSQVRGIRPEGFREPKRQDLNLVYDTMVGGWKTKARYARFEDPVTGKEYRWYTPTGYVDYSEHLYHVHAGLIDEGDHFRLCRATIKHSSIRKTG